MTSPEAQAADFRRLSAELKTGISETGIRGGIGFCYSIHERITVGGFCELPYRIFIHDKHDETEAHKEDFNDRRNSGNDSRTLLGIQARYWARRTFEGPFLFLSCIADGHLGTDAAAGCGYRCRIMDRLGAELSFELRLDDILNGKNNYGTIQVGLCYTF